MRLDFQHPLPCSALTTIGAHISLANSAQRSLLHGSVQTLRVKIYDTAAKRCQAPAVEIEYASHSKSRKALQFSRNTRLHLAA